MKYVKYKKAQRMLQWTSIYPLPNSRKRKEPLHSSALSVHSLPTASLSLPPELTILALVFLVLFWCLLKKRKQREKKETDSNVMKLDASGENGSVWLRCKYLGVWRKSINIISFLLSKGKKEFNCMIQRFQSDQFPKQALPFYVVRAAASIRANLDCLPNPRDMGHVESHCAVAPQFLASP